MKTAVEWLQIQLEQSGIPLLKDELEMIKQAKEMEKEQTINFAKANLEMSKVSQDYTFSYNHRIDNQIAVLDKYYNETYGNAKV
jgi:hypothetical protein